MSTIEAGRLTASKPEGSDGLSFQAVVDSARRLDELSCARVIGLAAEAVHAAQKSGQPIGTVTPSAIAVSRDGSVTLAPGGALPRYSAPETLRGGSVDRRSDVFSLGVVLWEALAHEPLFDGASDDAVKRAVLAGSARPPSEYNANVPAELDAICQRALSLEPANRYQSAKVMAAEIDAVLGDAGYPESNEAIATFVARALAGEASKPPTSKTSPLPAHLLAPAQPRSASSVTLPPAASSGAPRSSTGTLPPPLLGALSSTVPAVAASAAARATLAGAGAPSARSRSPSASGAAAGSSGRSKSASAPPPAAATIPSAGSAAAPRSSSATPGNAAAARSPGTAHPTPATGAPSSAVASSSVWTSPTGTSPSPFIVTRPPAPTAILGSASKLEQTPSSESQPLPPFHDAAPPPWADDLEKAQTVVSPPPQHLGTPPGKSPLAATAFLGSNAIASPPPAGPEGTRVGLPPPAAATRAPSSRGVVNDLPSFEPPAMPVAPGVTAIGMAAPPTSSSRHAAPAPFRPGHAHPRGKETVATADTAETPHLGAPPARGRSSQLAMPPGMTDVPTRLPSADTEFEDERHGDPAAVVALQHPEKGRDVLAGWGWSTGTTEAITDDDDFHDTSRAGRKRLVIAIGAALAVALVVALVAFAFSGSKKPSDDAQVAGAPSATTSPTAPVSPAAAVAAPAAAISPTTSAPATEPPSAAPVAPGAAPPPAAVVADPPNAVVADPPKAVVADPPKAVVADPPKAVVADPPKAVVADPPKAIVADPPKAIVADPPKAVVAPPHLATTKPLEPDPRKATTKKPPEPKRTTEPVKRPAPERVVKVPPRALPIDPYGGPDKSRTDPAAAYKSGLQQYAHGDTTGALATFRGSLSSSPGFAPTWRGLGLVYEKLGNKAQARSAFKRYLQLAPGASDADQIRDRLERLGS